MCETVRDGYPLLGPIPAVAPRPVGYRATWWPHLINVPSGIFECAGGRSLAGFEWLPWSPELGLGLLRVPLWLPSGLCLLAGGWLLRRHRRAA